MTDKQLISMTETVEKNQIVSKQTKQNKNQSILKNETQDKPIAQISQMLQNLKVSQEQQIIPKQEDEIESQSQDNNKSSQNQIQPETKLFIDINRNNIPFGKTALFPGSIQEVDVVIGLKDDIMQDNTSNNPFMLRVIAKCVNQQFNDLDEYVFSVRSNERYEYFEEVRFKIKKKQKAQVKVAVKIPPVKENCIIEGLLQIQLETFNPICLPIIAKCEVPQITCIKDLYKPDEDTQVIKIPAKKSQIRMPPIPFKNLSNFNFTLEVEAISNQNFQNRPYDIITQNFVNCQANMQFFVNLQLKENMSFKGPVPTKDTIRKILILKIKNSSVYYNYPLEIFVFQGSNAGGMS